MARKAKEILLARGYTEADLATMTTLLADPKFCLAIESEAADADTARAQATELQGTLTADQEWYNTYAIPLVKKTQQDAINARAEAAAANAKLQAAQDYGLTRVAEQAGATPAVPATPSTPATPAVDTSQFVTSETWNQGLELVGDSIEMAQDIVADHQDLFGHRLPGGLGSLRKDFKEAQKTRRYAGSIKQFWEEKYKVPDKRTEISQAAQAKLIADAELRGRNAAIAEGANPATRSMLASRSPFTNRGAATATPGAAATPGGAPAAASAGKQPWERQPEERSGARVSKFATKVLQSA